MSHPEPLTLNAMLAAFEDWQKPTVAQLKQALRLLEEDYTSRAIELKCLASGYCIQTKVRYSPWITRLWVEKPAKYSAAFLEVLAIIAYKQPVTRADIESMRGVAVNSAMLKGLLERGWIEVVGHRDLPGRPALYATTKAFLDYFNMASLQDLPSLVMNNEQ